MNKICSFLMLLLLLFAFTISADKIPDYKISNIKIIPFEQKTGKFENEITTGDTKSFFNDLGKALFISLEITGKPGSYIGSRDLEVIVKEGKKIKFKKKFITGVLSNNGNFYYPLFIEGPICSDIVITAKILGQKNSSSFTKKVPFRCGE